MLRLESYAPDVQRLHLSSWRSAVVGYSVSAYLVRGVLVDCGCHAARADLARWAESARPRGVILTHAHEDHAGNVELLARRGTRVAAGAGTLDLVRSVGERPIGFYRRWTWGSMPPLATVGDAFAPEEAGLALVPLPGHSADHHVVWDAERETLFGGDLFLGVKVRIAHAAEEPRTLVRSLRAAAALAPRRLFDAHRGLVSDPVERLRAKADWLEETIGRIDDLAARGWRDTAIRDRVLGREGMVGYFSGGEYSKLNLVRGAIRDS
jgi:glyoxylase-like metal-dependent hydrolase (beta-lactamase superfamily II)